MAGMLLETLFNLLNAFWVGYLGTLAFAAVNLASFAVWMLFALAAIVTTGTNAVVSQRIGAGDTAQARRAAHVGILTAFCLGILMAVPVQLYADDLLNWMASSNHEAREAVKIGTGYLCLIFLWAPIHCLNDTMAALFRSVGDTRTPLRIYSMGIALNFVLDPLLIFGWGPFPRLEVLGAALATNVSFTFVTVLYCTRLKDLPFQIGRRPGEDLRQVFSRHWLLEIVRIGLPPSIGFVTFCLVYMFLAPIVGSFGPPALAALGIGHRCESLSYLICHGFALATITLVGQNLGAGETERARKAAWVAVRATMLACTGVTAIYLLGAPLLVGLFSDDPAVLAVGVPYLRIMAFAQLPMGVAMVLQGAFSGAGVTIPPTIVSVTSSVLRVPLARFYALGQGLGLVAIWWVIVLLNLLQGLTMAGLFHLGLWKKSPKGPATTGAANHPATTGAAKGEGETPSP